LHPIVAKDRPRLLVTPGPHRRPGQITVTHPRNAARRPARRNFDAKPVPVLSDFVRRYFFSITHCRGCWCLRAKSITCVTFVSAIS
jgi:hypothetical protein